MAVPYRRAPQQAQDGCVAYLDVVRGRDGRTFWGALLVLDVRGQPLEFVHNQAQAPDSVLWSDHGAAESSIASLAHSLFDACRREPDLLACPESLGSRDFCRDEIAPSIPFAQILATGAGDTVDWVWINDPPAPGMRAATVVEEVGRRGLGVEPLSRLRRALREVYPELAGEEDEDDRVAPPR